MFEVPEIQEDDKIKFRLWQYFFHKFNKMHTFIPKGLVVTIVAKSGAPDFSHQRVANLVNRSQEYKTELWQFANLETIKFYLADIGPFSVLMKDGKEIPLGSTPKAKPDLRPLKISLFYGSRQPEKKIVSNRHAEIIEMKRHKKRG